ncbi:hypothetical protein RI844_11685 [Thalassotalea fonticola]|uniref:Uncharacterized protein n=1 Tax=Thalassotalea fonticola TaxID=3065649 RepID=A0ABZ0GJJ2_9GAMM|nr:hypothetical protein RI844_11685 [Colwelliaceae bacterium S1-1]
MSQAILFLTLIFTFNAYATTLANVEPIDVIKNSSRVIHVQVLEARYKELTPEENDYIPTCGTNVTAKVIHDYFGIEGKEIVFSIFGNIEVGSEYLVFLNKKNSAEWFKEEWWRSFVEEDEISSQAINCLKDSNDLKASSFPQRAIKIDYDYNLVFELNNMLIPKEVNIKTGKDSIIIMQYNQTLVSFQDFDKYLKNLIKSNNLIPATSTDATID